MEQRRWIAEDLEVFKRSYRLSLELHRMSLTFPKTEQFGGLADQLRRSSKSVCGLIVEGRDASRHPRRSSRAILRWRLARQRSRGFGVAMRLTLAMSRLWMWSDGVTNSIRSSECCRGCEPGPRREACVPALITDYR